jgi:hypothetical protein
LIIHILEKTAPILLPIVCVKIREKEREEKTERERVLLFLKGAVKNVFTPHFLELILSILIDSLKSEACYQRYLDDCSNAR